MRKFWRNSAAALTILTSVTSGGAALACIVSTPTTIESAASADLVFIGKFVKFKRYEFEGVHPGISPPYGQYTFSVIETLKGESQPEWKILWWVNVLGSNTRVDADMVVIVAATDGTATIQPFVESGALSRQDLDSSRYVIIEPACSNAPIFENTPENRAIVEAMLAQTREETQ